MCTLSSEKVQLLFECGFIHDFTIRIDSATVVRLTEAQPISIALALMWSRRASMS